MQAIILAGGLGTRLLSVVAELPKVMADVGGRPFLEHLLERLAAQGFDQAILAVGHKRQAIIDHFGHRAAGLSIAYSVEEEPLGTGGAIRQALTLADPAPCFVLNGDTWLDLDYPGMFVAHRKARAELSLAVLNVPDVGRFGALEISSGRVTGFREKGCTGPGAINAGVYLMNADLFHDTDLPLRFSFEIDFLAKALGRLRPLTFEACGDFIDIGVPDDYFRAQRLFAGRR